MSSQGREADVLRSPGYRERLRQVFRHERRTVLQRDVLQAVGHRVVPRIVQGGLGDGHGDGTVAADPAADVAGDRHEVVLVRRAGRAGHATDEAHVQRVVRAEIVYPSKERARRVA